MKRYNISRQEQENYCVPSVLQAILRNYGNEISQEQIASKLTPEMHGFSMTDERIITFLKEFNQNYRIVNYNEIPRDALDIFLEDCLTADTIVGINHHASLLVDFDRDVKILDPAECVVKMLKYDDFIKNLYSYSGVFGIVNLK